MEEVEINKILEEYVLYDSLTDGTESTISPAEEVEKYYTKINHTILSIQKQTNKTKEKISELLSLDRIPELYTLLKSIPIATQKKISSADLSPISLQEQRLQILDKYPSFKEISTERNCDLAFTCDISLVYKNLEKSLYHKFDYKDAKFNLIFNYEDPSALTKITTNINHPYLAKLSIRDAKAHYFNSNLLSRITGNFNNHYFSTVDQIIKLLTEVDTSLINGDISQYIFSNCPVCKLNLAQQEVVKCPKTNINIHKTCGKTIKNSGVLYHPDAVKTCSKCKNDSISWVNNGSIVCERCLNE